MKSFINNRTNLALDGVVVRRILFRAGFRMFYIGSSREREIKKGIYSNNTE